jgi:glycosyltransferase involved in cell wall biosynthesis
VTIGLVFDHGQIGGGETSLVDLATSFCSSDGARSVALCREDGPIVERLRRLGVPVTVIRWPTRFRFLRILPHFSLLAALRVRRWIRESGVGLVHANGPFGLLYAGLAARSLGRPVVFTSHLPNDVDGALKRQMARSIPNRIIPVSQALRHRLTDAGVAPDRVVAPVPLGVDLSHYDVDPEARLRLRLRSGWGDDDVVCAAVGRIQRVKGQIRFLQALGQARAQAPRLKGLILGSPWPGDEDGRRYDAEIDEAIQSLRLGDIVTRLPQTDDVRGALSAIDALVVPSDSESFGRIVVEAMACRRPVATTPCRGPEEIVADGETGLVADDMTPRSLAAAMTAIAASRDDRERMGEAGRRRAEERFSIGAQAERVIEVYQTLLRPERTDR